jgi:hypothetical protein
VPEAGAVYDAARAGSSTPVTESVRVVETACGLAFVARRHGPLVYGVSV